MSLFNRMSMVQRTLCGIFAGLTLWVFTMGIMLTDPDIETQNPGVFEMIQMFVPATDPETGEQVVRPRYLPVS